MIEDYLSAKRPSRANQGSKTCDRDAIIVSSSSQVNRELSSSDKDTSSHSSKSYSDHRVGINTIDYSPVELSNTNSSLHDSSTTDRRQRDSNRHHSRLNPASPTDQDPPKEIVSPEFRDDSSFSSLSWSLNDSPASLVIDCSDDRDEITPPSKPDVTETNKLNLSMRPRNLSSISERNESDTDQAHAAAGKGSRKGSSETSPTKSYPIRQEKLSATDGSTVTSTAEHSETETTSHYESSDTTVTGSKNVGRHNGINGHAIISIGAIPIENANSEHETDATNPDHEVNGVSNPTENEVNAALDGLSRPSSKNGHLENGSEIHRSSFASLSSQPLLPNGSKRSSLDSEFTSRSFNSSSVTGYKGSSETSNDSIDESIYKTRSGFYKTTKQRLRKAPFPLQRNDSWADDEMSNYTSGQSRRTSEQSCISQEAIDDLTRSDAKSVAAQIENLSRSDLPVIHTVLDSGSHRLSICSSFNGISSDVDDPDAQRISWKKGQLLGKGGFGVVRFT